MEAVKGVVNADGKGVTCVTELVLISDQSSEISVVSSVYIAILLTQFYSETHRVFEFVRLTFSFINDVFDFICIGDFLLK